MSLIVRRALIVFGVVIAVLGIAGFVVVRQFAQRLSATTARNSAPPMTQATAARQWDGTHDLLTGAKIELVGLCENVDPPKWWGIDGSPLSVPPIDDARKIDGVASLVLGMKAPNLQLCYRFYPPKDKRKSSGRPSFTIDGAGELFTYADSGIVGKPPNHVFVDLQRIAFNLPDGVRPTLRGDWNDAPFETFAIAKPGETVAGPLAVLFSADTDGSAHVKFTGEWQFPAEVAAIRKDGLLARKGVSFRMGGALGSTFDMSFDCKPEEIREVHFRMRALHRFVITGLPRTIGPPGMRSAAPLISEEDLPATLSGKGPIWTGELPEEEPWKPDAPPAPAKTP